MRTREISFETNSGKVKKISQLTASTHTELIITTIESDLKHKRHRLLDIFDALCACQGIACRPKIVFIFSTM